MKPAFLVFLIVLWVSMPRHLLPLGFAGGTVDGDWFELGANLATFGVIGFGLEPLVYRAPGFPAFVAAILKFTVDPATHSGDAVNAIGPIAVILAQSFLLAFSAALFFLWLSRRLSRAVSLAAALVFGTNPYSLVLVTLIHYDVLNWTLLIALVLALELAFASRGSSGVAGFWAAGMLLGAGVLVRPVALLAPFSLLVVFLLRERGRARWRKYAALLLGCGLVVLPWTFRNFKVTGRLIPVHAQGWSAFFASTSEVMVRNPDVFEWNIVAVKRYMPQVYRPATGEFEFHIRTYAREVLKIEDAAREASLKNLVLQPHFYLANFCTAITSLVWRVNAVILTAFTRVQTHEPFSPLWIAGGQPKTLVRGPEARAFQILHDLILWAAFWGLAVGLWRRDAFLAVPLAVVGSIVLAHALSYLDFYYYALKIPFLIAFGFYGVDALPRAGRLGLLVALCTFSLTLTGIMGFLS